MKNNLLNFYKNYYDLSNLNINVSNKNVLFLIYDDMFYYYLDKNKFIDFDLNKDINGLIKSINHEFKLEVTNYYPVCFCKETLIIALRISNNSHTFLKPMATKSIPKIYETLIEYHRKNYDMLYISSNVKNEIKTSQKYIKRYKFHEKVIKRFILTPKARKKHEYKELLENLIPYNKSIIDVSCGDNSDIFEIAKNKGYSLIVGNDICVNFLNTHSDNYVVYTNDDIELNKIKGSSYNFVYCKNTLHHMNNLTNINTMLSFLDKISSEEILIVEIVNPKEYGKLPKFLNYWLYTKFLKDVGNCFLNELQFKQVINKAYSQYEIQYSSFTNILGKYMIAKIKKGE